MAKKITTDENQDTIGTNLQEEGAESKKEPIKEVPQTEIPSDADEVLKSFSSYQTLYVDAHGGAYTSNTPVSIRGNSTLFKNPYYKS